MSSKQGRTNPPVFPAKKAERVVTLAAALLVLIGGMLAVAAWRRGQETTPERPQSTATPLPLAAPEPGATSSPAGMLTGWTILVDAGHGGYDGGARCRDSGVWEKELNLAVALAVEERLVQRGATVIMTRRTDVDLCEAERPAALTKKRQDMQNRVAMAADGQADMVLSIHMNEYRARGESGPQVFYRAGCDAGRLLAGCVQEALITGLQPPKKRVAMAGDYFILQLEIPSVLVECGFISNAQEERLLQEEAYQQKLAEAIAAGVTEYARVGVQ